MNLYPANMALFVKLPFATEKYRLIHNNNSLRDCVIHPINEFNLMEELSKVTSNTVGKMLCSQMSNCSLTLKDLVISESCTEAPQSSF